MGKFRPYLLWVAIPFGVCGFLTFSSFGSHETSKNCICLCDVYADDDDLFFNKCPLCFFIGSNVI